MNEKKIRLLIKEELDKRNAKRLIFIGYMVIFIVLLVCIYSIGYGIYTNGYQNGYSQGKIDMDNESFEKMWGLDCGQEIVWANYIGEERTFKRINCFDVSNLKANANMSFYKK